MSGNESNIAQDELQRGLEVQDSSQQTLRLVLIARVTCGIDYGIALIGNPGSGYVAGETFTVPGTAFSGGATPANDATITIDTVNGTGQILTVSITGTTGRTTRPVGEGAGIAPMLEKANGRDSGASQIEWQVNPATDYLDVTYNIKDNSILNADVNSAAAIAQSKLNMQAATTRANASGIAQADLGLAAFDDGDFTVTNGWVTLKSGNIDLSDLEEIPNNTALTNISGSTASATAQTITTTGGNDSIVMTKSDGTIRTTGLIVGADDNYTILQPKTGAEQLSQSTPVVLQYLKQQVHQILQQSSVQVLILEIVVQIRKVYYKVIQHLITKHV